MKKILIVFTMMMFLLNLMGCEKDNIEEPIEDDIYQLLIDAEDLSGIAEKTKVLITTDGSLGLPTSYQGVVISYHSRNSEIISDDGVVTRPNSCWIESRDQQGTDNDEFDHLNDNWPVIVDVTFTLEGQTRTAKLVFVVAPREGFTCDKYLG
ncbi:MAG: hypothetical protein K9L02_00140 [Acholeplasmataceae bacterium]|nr:hypothetical protein [Acholeplasmataceae bacterium]